MRVGIFGAGRIGGNVARQLAAAGHEVLLSFSRDPEKLERQAAEIGRAPRRERRRTRPRSARSS